MNVSSIIESIIWVVIFLVLFSYIIYPSIIILVSLLKSKTSISNVEGKNVSIIFSAYDEEKSIRDRIENIASQDYDLSLVEVLVGSDCSSDKTNDYLLNLEKQYNWLHVFIFNERRGKAMVINDLVKHAKYDILVFTDANTVFDKNALKNLLKGYSSEKIGGVSGRLVLTEPSENFDKSSQEKKYWEYETLIKKAEGQLGVLIGANGGIFSIRKKLFAEIPRTKAVTDDFFISLAVLSQGYKFIYKYNSFAFEEVARTVEDEFKRKVRFAATNFQTLFFFPELLFNKNILLSIAFWSHKVIRWFIPFMLIFLLIFSAINPTGNTLINYIFIAQLLFYICALFGKIGSCFKIRLPLFSLAYFFVLTNYALILGFMRFISGKHTVIWQSTPR